MLDKKGYMHARACTRPRARANAHARAHSKYVIFIALTRQQSFANASHCYVIRTLSVLCDCVVLVCLGTRIYPGFSIGPALLSLHINKMNLNILRHTKGLSVHFRQNRR